jgi:branched-chain amino acid transport system ATP-binding protein
MQPDNGNAPAAAAPVLRLDKVCAYYGNLCAVRDVSLEVLPGETVCIIGPNGAGKSTLLKAISRVLSRVEGGIHYRGASTLGSTPQKLVAQGLIHVPEGRQIFASMTVEENIEIGAYALPGGAAPADVEAALDLFPKLRERRRQLAGTLSGGEQQMLAMARALMGKPQLLMLDEPSMGLAPLVVNEIYRQVDLLRQRGVTILLVEQNARIALRNSDRALVMGSGEIRHQGRSADLLQGGAIASLVFGH